MPRFKVYYTYHSIVSVEVEAKDCAEAEEKAEEAKDNGEEFLLQRNEDLQCPDVTVEEI